MLWHAINMQNLTIFVDQELNPYLFIFFLVLVRATLQKGLRLRRFKADRHEI